MRINLDYNINNMETRVNNKCKAFTSLEQSKKLAEILPLESADMTWEQHGAETYVTIKPWTTIGKSIGCHCLNCWSLAALISILPLHLIVNNQRYAFSMHKGLNKGGETYIFRYNVFNTDVCLYATDYYNNPVDACVAMIEKLHELNLL